MAYNKIIFGNETLIDLTADTVDKDKLLRGQTAHDKSGALITGECDFDSGTTDATAIASEILSGRTAYVNREKLEGTMPNRGSIEADISTLNQEIAIDNGFHDGGGKVKIADTEKAKLVERNIRQGVEILGVTGTMAGKEDVRMRTETATPYTTEKVYIPEADIDGFSQVTVSAIAFVETANAAGGMTATIGTLDPDA